MSQSKKKDF